MKQDNAPPLPTVSAEELVEDLRLRLGSPLAALLVSIELARERLVVPAAAEEVAEAREILAEAYDAALRIRAVVEHMSRQVGHAARTSALVPATADEDGRRGSARVLVIDHDPVVGGVLRRALQGYDVVLIADAETALARIRAGERFEFILCEPFAAGESGALFHDQVRAVDPSQAENVVLLSGAVSTRDARALLDTLEARRQKG